MAKFVIEGGRKLAGRIAVAGDKNSILPILAAAVLTKGEIILENVPRIADVETMLSILAALGAEHDWVGEHSLRLDTRQLSYADLLLEETRKLRGSILFLGSMLGRFGKVKTYHPGGDIIGARPIETHLKGLATLGVRLHGDGHLSGVVGAGGARVAVLPEASVTGTETLMLFCARRPGVTQLKLTATEPSVQALGRFLQQLGVKIEGLGTPFMTIRGTKQFVRRVRFTLPPDSIETATFVAVAGATRGNITITGITPTSLDALFLVMDEMGFNYKVKRNTIAIKPSRLRGVKIQTGLYPKFMSDMQPPFGVLATQARGVTFVHDWLYENRFGYLRELTAMGANVEIPDPHRALIIGPTPLTGTEVRSLDIRAGMALIIAGLVAKGTTIIHGAENIERGYERVAERLQALGARVRWEE